MEPALLPRSCWAILPEHLEAIIALVQSEAAQEAFFQIVDHTQGEDAEPAAPYALEPDGTAVIAMKGPMVAEEDWLTAFLGAVATPKLTDAVRAAASAEDVSRIRIEVDSPGGEVQGVHNLARAVRSAASVKPVEASVGSLCASAALWAVAGASVITAGPDSLVGSVGVYQPVFDTSKRAEMNGVEVSVIANTGATHKADGYPGTPITAAVKKEKRRVIDGYASLFHQDLALGRGLTGERLDAVTDGRVHLGADAKALGLVDVVRESDPTTPATPPAAPEDPSATPMEAARNEENLMQKNEEQINGLVASFGNFLRGLIGRGEDAPEAQTGAPAAAAAATTDAADEISDGEAYGLVAVALGLDGADALLALVEDGKRHRDQIAAAYATEYNRVFGPGSMDAARATAVLSGMSAEEALAEVRKMATKADEQFEDPASGRTTEPETPAGEDEDAAKAKAREERVNKTLLALRQRHGV